MDILRRRDLLAASTAWALTALPSMSASAANNGKLQRKAIGRHTQRLPIVGIGTNRFRLEKLADLRAVIARMAELGGTVIDTAAAYGESEETLGTLLAERPGLRDRFFLATKLAMAVPGSAVLSPADSLARSLARLRTDRIDLLQVHNLQGTAEALPQMREWQRERRIRYIGLTTSRAEQHAQLIAEMRQHEVDFIQVDYSIGNRRAADEVLPAARAQGVGVLVNLPLGGGRGQNLVSQAGDRPLPDFARRAGIASWGQFCLAYVTSHPAVTCAIPGSTQTRHLEDNQQAARIAPPDARLRQRMEEFWDREFAAN